MPTYFYGNSIVTAGAYVPPMVSTSRRRSRPPRWLAGPLALLLALLAVAACGGSDDGGDNAGSSSGGGGSGGEEGDPIVLGYSAWPGWFPWKVAEEEGIFEQVGVDVELKWFDDYLASLTALSAGELDGNSQTLNDTLVGISGGSDQVVVLVNDNSAGNDAIIVDQSINSIEDLRGRTVAAEPGVVDHFLLLQGLDSAGMTEDDIQFSGLPTADAAAAFASGQVDAAGVFAPFTLEALKRPGSKVLFDSSDYPGTIPDFLVLDRKLVEERPEDVQKLVDAWYATLTWIAANPEAATMIMAEQAGVSVEDYASFANGTKIFTPDQALASLQGTSDVDLGPMAEQVADFLPSSGLVEDAPSLDGLYDASFTQDYVSRHGG
jgi:NitT/TauT family transport system substrate-binding protein